MTIQRNLSGKVDEGVRRTIVEMDARLGRFERVLTIIANRAFTNGGAAGLTPQQRSDIAGLIGALGQRLIADGPSDPVIAQVGTGTLNSFTVTAGNQLTGGGSITADGGTITLAVSVTPLFTTVNVTTQYNVAGTKVVGAQGAAVADVASPDATDLPTVITLANEIKAQFNTWLARARASTGHGLIG